MTMSFWIKLVFYRNTIIIFQSKKKKKNDLPAAWINE